MLLRRLAFPRSLSRSNLLSSALLTALTVQAGALGACSKEEEVKPDMTPKLGLLELASSHRIGDPEPSGATRIEITQAEVFVDGVSILPLENGKVPAAEKSGYELPKLKAKLAGKKSVAVSVYAAVPYSTLGRALDTAVEAGVGEFSFKVRKPNSSNQAGWITLRNIRFIKSAEDAQFPESQLLSWDSFAKNWDESLDACQSSQKADCGYRPMAKAEGGKLDMMLRVRGTGYALRFRQEGAPAPVADAGVPSEAVAEKSDKKKDKKKDRKKKGKTEMLEGLKAAPSASAEPAAPPPSTEHVFTLRTDQATIDPSPISGITRPICSATACPIVLEPEGVSMSSQVLALLGAAFPDGTPAPQVAWVLPPKD